MQKTVNTFLKGWVAGNHTTSEAAHFYSFTFSDRRKKQGTLQGNRDDRINNNRRRNEINRLRNCSKSIFDVSVDAGIAVDLLATRIMFKSAEADQRRERWMLQIK
ncbi:Protein CBG27577 [Caenorhabditis briggsae]|nr:Protein CBG27577 [Caenorhabditis briggsae]CAR98751.1 Protein CBG27577 [Caenorhabditis briggsae]